MRVSLIEKTACLALISSILFACSPNSSSSTVELDYPSDMAELKGPTSTDAPNEILYRWQKRSLNLAVADAGGTEWKEESRFNIVRGSFDASDYILDDLFLEALMDATEIEWLYLGPHATGDVLESIGQMTWLRGLSIWGCDCHDGELAQLANLENLEWLDLSRIGFDQQTSRLPDLPNLEVLILRYTGIRDEQLPDNKQFPNLKVLDLSGHGLTDQGIEKIAHAFPRLRYLSLYYQDRITPKSIVALTQLSSLKFLAIGLSGLIGEDFSPGVASSTHLRRKLPKCYVDVAS